MCIELARPKRTRASRKRKTKSRKTTPTNARARRKQRRAEAWAKAVEVPRPTPPRPLLPAFAGDAHGLVRAFEAGTLDRKDWTHAAHLVVALTYAYGHREDAYTRLRDGIRRYNAATGLVETETRGYHETITRAWFHLVLHFLDLFDEGQPLQDLADDLIVLFSRDDLFTHYSREHLLSPAARGRWVAPDREPLPELEPLTPADRRWLKSLEARTAVEAPALAAVA